MRRIFVLRILFIDMRLFPIFARRRTHIFLKHRIEIRFAATEGLRGNIGYFHIRIFKQHLCRGKALLRQKLNEGTAVFTLDYARYLLRGKMHARGNVGKRYFA